MAKDSAKEHRQAKGGCRCDICGCDMRLLRELSADTGIYFCEKDDLYKAAPGHPPAIESGASYLEFLADFRKNSIKRILDELPKQMNGGLGDVQGLEVGCGSGLFMELAKERGYSMLGMEPSSGAYEIAKQKSLNVIQGMFPEDLPERLRFDFIIFNDVFEHLPDAYSALRCCADHLKPGGVICINVPVSSGPIYRVAHALIKIKVAGDIYRRLWQIGTPSPHKYYFSRKSMKGLAGKCQLGVSSIIILDATERSIVKTYKRLRGYNALAADLKPPGPAAAAAVSIGLLAINTVARLWGGDVNCFFLSPT